MITGSPETVRNYTSGAAIAARRIVKFDSTDGVVIQAAAATDAMVGVSDLGCTASGDRLDIIRSGLVPVEYGGTITRGALLTADSNGKAVAAAPSAGANVRVIGIAEVSGVSGDVGLVMLEPGQIQG